MTPSTSMRSVDNHRGGSTIRVPRRGIFFSGWRCLLLAILVILAVLWVYFMNQISGEHDVHFIINNEDAPPGNSSNTHATKNVQQRSNNGQEEEYNRAADDAKRSAAAIPMTAAVVATTHTKDHQSPRLVLNEKYLHHLRSLEPFPKKLSVLFPDKDYYKRQETRTLPFVTNGILRFMKLNPEWNVTVYDDADMDGIIEKAAGDGIISMEEMRILLGDEKKHSAKAHPVERADLARMLIMWYYGGMYVDADALDNPKQFDQVFHSTVKMCLPIYLDINFSQSLVCSSPGNQLYLTMIKQMSKHRMTSNDGGPLERRDGWARREALFDMGPPMFNRVIFGLVFGTLHAGTGNIEGIEDDMRLLQKEASDLIATGQFVDECHSFIANPYEGCKLWNRASLYRLYNMSSWGKAVKERWGEEK